MISLTMMLGADSYFAFIASSFTAIGPAFPFLTAIYSESLFNLLAVGGLLAFCLQRRILAGLIWCLAGLTRSNGVLLSGYFFYDALYHGFCGPRRVTTSMD